MLTTENRHNRHIFIFDYNMEGDERKALSDEIVNFLGLDTNEFFVADILKDSIYISNVFHDKETYINIRVMKKKIGMSILCREYYLQDNIDIKSLLDKGRNSIGRLKDIFLSNDKFDSFGKISDELNIMPVNSKSEHEKLKDENNRSEKDYSIKLLKKIKENNVDDKLADYLLKRERFMHSYFNGRSICYQTLIEIQSSSELEYLFKEVL